MKPIIKKEQQDTILTSEITRNHIVVCADTKHGYILTRDCDADGKYYYRNVGLSMIEAERTPTEYISIEKSVNWMMAHDDVKIEVFNKSDWKLALQWLIDNA